MSDGFQWTESYWNLFGKTADIYYGNRLHKVVGTLNSEYAPGEKYEYFSSVLREGYFYEVFLILF